LINPEEKVTKEVKKDGSGNIKLDDIGEYLKESIVKTIKQKYNFVVNLKYIDPTYAIRSVAANGEDTIMCSKLA
jgi:6-phosphofructokinase 1